MRKAVLLAVLGVGLGIFSVVGDAVAFLSAPANAVGPWIVTAFAAGAIASRPRQGAVVGAAVLLVAVVAYYAGSRWVWGDAFVSPVRAAAVWAAVALLVGTPIGWAGGAWSAAVPRWSTRGVALLAGLLLAEAITRFVEVEGWTGIDFGRTALQVWAYDMVAALAAPILLLERSRWLAAYATSVLVGTVGAVALALAISLIRASATGA